VATPPLTHAIRDSIALLRRLGDDARAMERAGGIADLLVDAFQSGGKVMICGNGGSACDAAHFAEELTGRFRTDRPPLPALACTDVGHVTCTGNDYGFEYVFSRWVAALGRPGDVLILLSTSGNSPNLLRARDAGAHAGMKTVALLGKTGGELKGRCDHEVLVPGDTSDRIQELHMLLLHALVEHVEAALFPRA